MASSLNTFLKECGLEGKTQQFVDAGFTKVSDLVELVGGWTENPEKKELFNTLCEVQLGLSGMHRLRLLTGLKKQPTVPAAEHMEVEEQKETAKGDDAAKNNAIDLAFLLDTTGSMGSYIASAQRNIREIVRKVKQDQDADVRFALVSYKDYTPGDTEKLVSRHGEAGVAQPPQQTTNTTSSSLLGRLGSLFGASAAPSKARAKKKVKRRGAPRSGGFSFGGGYGSGSGFEDGTAARIYDFTTEVGAMQGYVDMQVASGGGDGPEAVATALDCAENLSWRENSAKIAVLIADAPPHGIEPSGDNFPQGDPIDRDALTIARALADKDVSIYTVACEPAVTNQWRYCRDFMEGVAEIGGGMLIPLANSQLLVDMILASCKEGADLGKMQAEVEKELGKLKKANPKANQDQLAEMAASRLASRGFTSAQVVDSSNAYGGFNKRNVNLFSAEHADMRKVKASLVPQAAPANWDRGMASQMITSSRSGVTMMQCKRMMKKKARKWGY